MSIHGIVGNLGVWANIEYFKTCNISTHPVLTPTVKCCVEFKVHYHKNIKKISQVCEKWQNGWEVGTNHRTIRISLKSQQAHNNTIADT